MRDSVINMNKIGFFYISLIILFINSSYASCVKHNLIFNKDTISFSRGFLGSKFYEIENIQKVINNQYTTSDSDLSYPHLFFARLSSEKEILFRNDFFFIEGKTNMIRIDSLKQIKIKNSKAQVEFENFFKIFIIKDQNKSFQQLMYDNREIFDSKLFEYINNNNNSFVALWFVILRFHEEGHKHLYENMLSKFSNKIKSSKLWQLANIDLNKIQIKENYNFPKFELINTNLKNEKINLPLSKYTYIDFWWSRCKPCLEKIPKVIELYNEYHKKGFNVIAISTDKTANIEKYWLKRIEELKIPWKQYLDQNGEISNNNYIFSFPTNYLLDSNGVIIAKNISLNDLEVLLLELNK